MTERKLTRLNPQIYQDQYEEILKVNLLVQPRRTSISEILRIALDLVDWKKVVESFNK